MNRKMLTHTSIVLYSMKNVKALNIAQRLAELHDLQPSNLDHGVITFVGVIVGAYSNYAAPQFTRSTSHIN